MPCRLSGACDAGLSVLSPAPNTVTSMFLHGARLHLGGNMLYLWIFDDSVGDTLGHGRFLIFFPVSGVIAAVAQVALRASSSVPMIGAKRSGVGGPRRLSPPLPPSQCSHPRHRGFLRTPVPDPVILVLGVWFLIQFVSGLLRGTARADGGRSRGLSIWEASWPGWRSSCCSGPANGL